MDDPSGKYACLAFCSVAYQLGWGHLIPNEIPIPGAIITQKTFLYVGTYTRDTDFLSDPNGEGIYIYEFDASSGNLDRVGEMFGIDNPSYLTIDHSKRYLYANSEVYQWHEGTVTAFSIHQETGVLAYLNKQSTLGNTSAYVSVDQTDRYVLVANYGDRHGLAMFPIKGDGSLSSASDSHEFDEIPVGTVPERQNRSHVHCVIVDPGNTYAIVNDLGLDKIFVFKIDFDSGKLIPHDPTFVEVLAGGGPRHSVFHPNGRYLYACLELSSSVAVLEFDGESGKLEVIQTVLALPDDFDGFNISSDIHVTPSGKYLYMGNRGHNSLAMFSINADTGLLTLIGHQSSKGQSPRNFAIDPTGDYVLVANQDSDNIVVFRIDHETGKLLDTGIMVECGTPVCLKFVEIA